MSGFQCVVLVVLLVAALSGMVFSQYPYHMPYGQMGPYGMGMGMGPMGYGMGGPMGYGGYGMRPHGIVTSSVVGTQTY